MSLLKVGQTYIVPEDVVAIRPDTSVVGPHTYLYFSGGAVVGPFVMDVEKIADMLRPFLTDEDDYDDYAEYEALWDDEEDDEEEDECV